MCNLKLMSNCFHLSALWYYVIKILLCVVMFLVLLESINPAPGGKNLNWSTNVIFRLLEEDVSKFWKEYILVYKSAKLEIKTCSLKDAIYSKIDIFTVTSDSAVHRNLSWSQYPSVVVIFDCVWVSLWLLAVVSCLSIKLCRVSFQADKINNFHLCWNACIQHVSLTAALTYINFNYVALPVMVFVCLCSL